jgi:hypothetical protein
MRDGKKRDSLFWKLHYCLIFQRELRYGAGYVQLESQMAFSSVRALEWVRYKTEVVAV